MSINIGDIVIDLDGTLCRVVGLTSNSIEVHIKAKTEKGIDCNQWFEEKKFFQRFKSQKQ